MADINNWYDRASFYHIYPLGYCGAEEYNNFEAEPQHRILKVKEFIPNILKLNLNAIYFGPIFESTRHGYDTADYAKIDRRLGTNDDFADVCNELHKNGISVIVDGVFNHVGRDFWAFKDVLANKFSSRYRDWFIIRDGNSNYNDGFYYEGWEGHYELVKLNLYNGEVKDYLCNCITEWINAFHIDGIRLDVAYCLEEGFLRQLHSHCKGIKSDFFLIGETLHGDYNKWLKADMLDSVTNYECYKGIYSSFNELNMFEIAYSLNRQFGNENWCLYRGKNLYNFVDNHDVTRIASILKEKKHLPLVYAMLFTMPGIPAVYYGSEYGIYGDKSQGDAALRPEFTHNMVDESSPVFDVISKLARLRMNAKPLCVGSYKQLQLTNRQLAYVREADGKCVITLLNADVSDFVFNLNMNNMGGEYVNALNGQHVNVSNGIRLEAHSAMVLAPEEFIKLP